MSKLVIALASAIQTMPEIKKTKANYNKGKYAPLDAVRGVVIPHLASHGISYHESIEPMLDNFVLKGTLTHLESGETLVGVLPLFMSSAAQQNGINITYGRRYLIQVLAGVTPEEDTDGEHKRSVSTPAPGKTQAPSGQTSANGKTMTSQELIAWAKNAGKTAQASEMLNEKKLSPAEIYAKLQTGTAVPQ